MRQLHRDVELEFHGQQKSAATQAAFAQLLDALARKNWVVYAKRPFAGPKVVLAYLARYTHRIGITNHRVRALDKVAGTVSFAYKDYADDSRQKTMTVSCEEFVRRLRLHILPERFEVVPVGWTSGPSKLIKTFAGRASGLVASEERGYKACRRRRPIRDGLGAAHWLTAIGSAPR